MYGSRLRPVMAVTALMWPRFSPTRMITTGAISVMALVENSGVSNFGMPNQAASAMRPKLIGSPRPMPFVRIA